MSEGARFALALLGAVLLLPGACSLYFTPLALPLLRALPDILSRPGDGQSVFYLLAWLMWPAGLLLAALGIRLMWRAARD